MPSHTRYRVTVKLSAASELHRHAQRISHRKAEDAGAYGSALRNHGDPKPVQLYLFQPPKGVIAAIRDYFGDCRIEAIPELSETCLTAASTARTYGGVQTKVARLEHFLIEEWDGIRITPEEIRNKVGLTKSQYKEARKSAKIRDFFDRHVTTCGSGSNTYYLKNLAMNG